ncbi:MAG: transglutaminaseTgpA domain-containing protein, partial [Pseudoclavibacter sp.]
MAGVASGASGTMAGRGATSDATRGRQPGADTGGRSPGTTAATRQVRDPASTGSWFVSLALALVIAAATLLARSLFTTSSWGGDAIVMIVAVIGGGAIVRTFLGGVLWPTLASIIAFIVVLSIRLQPDSVVDFFAVWGREGLLLIEQLVSDAPPLRETHEAVTALIAIVGVIAMLCDLFVFGLRGRVSAVLPVLVFPILPVAVGVPDVDLMPALWLAGAFALYLFATAWWHQRVADDRLADAGYLVDGRGMSGWIGAVGVAAAGVVIALVASFVVPTPPGVAWLTPGAGASLSTNRANPILDLGDDLRRGEPVNVLQYATSLSSGQLPYLSLVTLSELDGASEWAPGDFASDVTTAGGAQLPQPAGLAAGAPYTSFGANVIVEQGVSAYLPHPGAATRVQNLSTDYGYQLATGDLRQVDGEPLGQHFEYSGVRLDVAPELIAAAAYVVPDELEASTSVPEGAAADRIRAALDGIIDPNAPHYAQAQQVQAYLTSDEFTYSETSPVTEGYDGTNLDVTAQFLDTRAGYCVHFSSAMAVMARMLGIPSRVQVGFTPGTPISINSQDQVVYQVTSHDLHAWAELWIDGYGWVPFESTPAAGVGNTIVPDISEVDDTPTEEPTETTEEPVPDDEVEQTAVPQATPSEDPAEAGSQDDGAGDDASAPWLSPAVALAGLIALAVLLVLAVPAVARALQRRRRRAAVLAGAPGAPAIAWRELLSEAVDHR